MFSVETRIGLFLISMEKPKRAAIVAAFDRVKLCSHFHGKWITFAAFAQAISRDHDLEESASLPEGFAAGEDRPVSEESASAKSIETTC